MTFGGSLVRNARLAASQRDFWRKSRTKSVPYRSVPQECPTRVSHKSVLQEYPTRVSYKSVPQECPTRVSRNSVPQECPTRVSHKSLVFIRTSPVLVFHTHTCLLIALIACLHTHHLHTYTCILPLAYFDTCIAYFALHCFRSSTYTGLRIAFMLSCIAFMLSCKCGESVNV